MKHCDPPQLFKSFLKKIAIGLPLFLCLLALAGINTSAYAATTQRTFCQVILQKAASQEAFSPASPASCSAQPLASPKDAIPLITLYSQPGFQGKTITYYGYQGPCDDVGYHISYTGSLWDHIVSGFKAGPTCQGVRLYKGRNMQGDCHAYQGEAADVAPDGFANVVQSIQVSDKKFDCDGQPAPAPGQPAPAPPTNAGNDCSAPGSDVVKINYVYQDYGTKNGSRCYSQMGTATDISATNELDQVTSICTKAAQATFNYVYNAANYVDKVRTRVLPASTCINATDLTHEGIQDGTLPPDFIIGPDTNINLQSMKLDPPPAPAPPVDCTHRIPRCE